MAMSCLSPASSDDKMIDGSTKSFNDDDHRWMAHAMRLAETAANHGEVPVGAVVIKDNTLVGSGFNRNIEMNDPSAHAEILAMRAAGKKLANYRLVDCTLYVTLEPCPMCAGAMIHARLKRVVFAASDPKTGAAGGQFDLLGDLAHNHAVKVEGGCCAAQSSTLLKSFFRQRR